MGAPRSLDDDVMVGAALDGVGAQAQRGGRCRGEEGEFTGVGRAVGGGLDRGDAGCRREFLRRRRSWIELAQQLLAGLDLRATGLTTQIAALVRDAGTSGNLEDRARLLRTGIDNAGLNSAQPTLELAMCFHHAALGAHGELAAETARLREIIQGGDYVYYVDIAQFMATSLCLSSQRHKRGGSTENSQPANGGELWSGRGAITCAQHPEGAGRPRRRCRRRRR